MKQEFFKLGKSFRAAWHGLCSVVRRERNFRVHLVVSAYVLAFAWLGRVSGAQLALLFACIGLVLALELVNTAVETLCDRVTTKQDEQIGKVKDFAAAAVLIAALMAAAAGLAIFLSKPVLLAVWGALCAAPHWGFLLILALLPAFLFIFRFKK